MVKMRIFEWSGSKSEKYVHILEMWGDAEGSIVEMKNKNSHPRLEMLLFLDTVSPDRVYSIMQTRSAGDNAGQQWTVIYKDGLDEGG